MPEEDEIGEWVVIPHGEDKTPGWWKNDKGWVFFRDPNGHTGRIDDSHTIWGPENTVSPSVWCTDEDCDFHEHIILEDYDAHAERD